MESSDISSYPHEILEFIRKTTRLVQFNFDEVAKIINSSEIYQQYQERNGKYHEMTPKECREIFANDYNSYVSTSAAVEKKVESGKTRGIQEIEQEPKSLNDVLEFHERMRKENDRKIDQIFKRVLGVLETTEKVSLNDNDEVVIAHRQRIEIQESERQRKILLEEEQREIEVFETQRAKLKKRFDLDSEDAEGIDPLAQRSEGLSSFLSQIKNLEHEEDDITAHVPHQLSAAFDIEALLNTAEFDQLLSSIERDLDEKSNLDADSKEGKM